MRSAVGGEVAEAVAALVEEQFARGEQLGVQVAARWKGRCVVDLAAGWRDAARTSPVDHDTLFCCFSVTKALAAREVWRLLDDGRLDPDGLVSLYWKGFRAPMTVAQLLTHQGGLHRAPRPLHQEFLVDPDVGLPWVAGLDPAWPPGEATGYHTLTYGWLVRGLVEAATGQPFPRQLGPDVFVGLPSADAARAAAIVEPAHARGLGWVAGRDHPAAHAMDPSFVPDWNHPEVRAACQPAFSGWASAAGLAAHIDTVPARQFQPATAVAFEGEDRCLELPVRRGWGVELGGRYEGGAVGALGPNPAAFGHGGHGGQVVVRDPDAELTIAVLVNLLAPPELAAERTTTICELIRALCGAY
ncbi:MAG: serine hydrolase domain-containing protein [Acidimicrobiales bacterium]